MPNLVGLLLIVLVSTTYVTTKPSLKGGFVMIENCLKWTATMWHKEFQAMKDVQMDTVIIRNVAHVNTSYYPSNIPGMNLKFAHVLPTVLDAAEKVGLNVILGIRFSLEVCILLILNK
jgi:hypothetical protein